MFLGISIFLKSYVLGSKTWHINELLFSSSITNLVPAENVDLEIGSRNGKYSIQMFFVGILLLYLVVVGIEIGNNLSEMNIEAFLRKHLLGDCYWKKKKEVEKKNE